MLFGRMGAVGGHFMMGGVAAMVIHGVVVHRMLIIRVVVTGLRCAVRMGRPGMGARHGGRQTQGQNHNQ